MPPFTSLHQQAEAVIGVSGKHAAEQIYSAELKYFTGKMHDTRLSIR